MLKMVINKITKGDHFSERTEKILENETNRPDDLSELRPAYRFQLHSKTDAGEFTIVGVIPNFLFVINGCGIDGENRFIFDHLRWHSDGETLESIGPAMVAFVKDWHGAISVPYRVLLEQFQGLDSNTLVFIQADIDTSNTPTT